MGGKVAADGGGVIGSIEWVLPYSPKLGIEKRSEVFGG